MAVGGLVAGKTVGVLGAAYLMARFTRARLDEDLRWVRGTGHGLTAPRPAAKVLSSIAKTCRPMGMCWSWPIASPDACLGAVPSKSLAAASDIVPVNGHLPVSDATLGLETLGDFRALVRPGTRPNAKLSDGRAAGGGGTGQATNVG